MRREDCVDIFKKIPEVYHAQVNLVMQNQNMVTVDMVVRFEANYLAMRGREGGSTDEGRAFFIPYDEISYLRIERVVKVGELKGMFGEVGYIDAEDALAHKAQMAEKGVVEDGKSTGGMDSQTPPPAGAAQDPAAIAKKNLLDRIRAARTNASGSTGKLAGK